MDITLDTPTPAQVSRPASVSVPGLLLKYALLLLTVAVFIVPMFWMLSASLKDLQEIYTFPPQWIPSAPKWSN